MCVKITYMCGEENIKTFFHTFNLKMKIHSNKFDN